jgi:2-methylisocitrate lyase-like PEP mutase family enzyme
MRRALDADRVLPFIGVYDTFSASLAARRFETLFLSGFGFAASTYGLPDVGFISWTDVVCYVQRVRAVAPTAHLLVDIDDGYGDPVVAAHAAMHVEEAGGSGIVLEDQERPRRCGHLEGKRVLPLDLYLDKLHHVLDARHDLFVVARTDATDPDDMLRRAHAFAATGADAVLVDGLKDLDLARDLAAAIDKPLCFNQIAGGRSAQRTLTELDGAGVRIAIHSTPCLFAAQAAVEQELDRLVADDGRLLGPESGALGLADCARVLDENLAIRTMREGGTAEAPLLQQGLRVAGSPADAS